METEPIRFDLRGIIENSLLEWENMVSAVVIAGGCNLRCPYCHSWRYVTGLDDLRRLDIGKLFELLERQRGWIDGVVFTGGEATMQPDLPRLIERVREYGVRTKLHTNGSRPDVLRGLLERGMLDCLSLDYKTTLNSGYFNVAGIREDGELLERVRESFRLAAASETEREYHTTLAPRFVGMQTLRDMARDLEPGGLWILQQLETDDCLDGNMAGTVRYTADELDAFLTEAKTGHERVLLKKGSSA